MLRKEGPRYFGERELHDLLHRHIHEEEAFEIGTSPSDPFVRAVERSGKKWVVLVDRSGDPHLLLNADSFLRSVLFGVAPDPLAHCYRPFIAHDPAVRIGMPWSS